VARIAPAISFVPSEDDATQTSSANRCRLAASSRTVVRRRVDEITVGRGDQISCRPLTMPPLPVL